MKKMMTRAVLGQAVLAVAALSCAVLTIACAGGGTTVPYYDSAEFTPRWQPTMPRRVAFALTDQRGQPFSSDSLAGTVYVASFIYTRCSVICPALVSSLKRAQDRAGDNLVLLSFSVTPEVDTPEVLASFGRERGIDPGRWKLLTGQRAEIYRLARDVYFAGDNGLRATLADPTAVLHTEKLVLVDGLGRIRGVYDGTLPRDIDHLVDDATTLMGDVR